MSKLYDRAKLLIGEQGQQDLGNAHVAVVGIGGVGSYVVEALARAGIGTITLVDHDSIDETNINRQIHALQSTIGRAKVVVMAERVGAINPEIQVITKQAFLLPDCIEQILEGQYDYIVDAIDTVTGKLALVDFAKQRGIPVICSMGTANKIDNTSFQIVDISKTEVCPLARVMRRELKKRGITSGVQVVYSPTECIKPDKIAQPENDSRRETPGSISFVPGTAGLMIAGVVVRAILERY